MGCEEFFLDLAGPPLTLQINRSTGLATLANPDDASVALSAYSITSAGGQLSPARWSSLADQATAGWSETQALATGVAEASAGNALTLGASGGTASLGSPYAGQPIAFRVDAPSDLTFQHTVDGDVRTGTVEYTGESLNNLTLKVDFDTGLARLENTSPFAVSIDAYTVSSASLSLDPASWRSLDDQDAAGGQWSEANVGAGRVSELQSSSETPLAPGDSFEMGQLFNAGGQQDLVFDFLLAGDSTSLRGVVLYTDVRLAGDYNDNGIVDAADYTLWRNSLGQIVPIGTGADGNHSGTIDQDDYNVWKGNFGMTVGSGSAAGPGSAVPEPNAMLITCLAVGCCALVRRPQQHAIARVWAA